MGCRFRRTLLQSVDTCWYSYANDLPNSFRHAPSWLFAELQELHIGIPFIHAHDARFYECLPDLRYVQLTWRLLGKQTHFNWTGSIHCQQGHIGIVRNRLQGLPNQIRLHLVGFQCFLLSFDLGAYCSRLLDYWNHTWQWCWISCLLLSLLGQFGCLQAFLCLNLRSQVEMSLHLWQKVQG